MERNYVEIQGTMMRGLERAQTRDYMREIERGKAK